MGACVATPLAAERTLEVRVVHHEGTGHCTLVLHGLNLKGRWYHVITNQTGTGRRPLYSFISGCLFWLFGIPCASTYLITNNQPKQPKTNVKNRRRPSIGCAKYGSRNYMISLPVVARRFEKGPPSLVGRQFILPGDCAASAALCLAVWRRVLALTCAHPPQLHTALLEHPLRRNPPTTAGTQSHLGATSSLEAHAVCTL